jgi:3-isopropylmalate/(R)-2-methylmalate dehydratase small subunit
LEKFTKITGVAAPLMRRNIDTDAIIPGKELTKVEKTGYGDGLFGQWRYTDGKRTENPDFVLNRPPYRKAIILLADANFGCGSSREAAVWALMGFGIRCVIAPSFGPIFFNNCFKNSLLPIIIKDVLVHELAERVEASGGQAPVTVDLESDEITGPGGRIYRFKVNEFFRGMLIEGLDPIDATLKFEHEIDVFQEKDKLTRPWIYQYQNK